MCWHKYKYIGWVQGQRWWGGVSGGILVPADVEVKQCTKCGKKKIINQ